jgi:transposase
MGVPGVAPVTALSLWAAAIDDPDRFARSSGVRRYLGLTHRRYASGEVDRSACISKCGDREVRTRLYEAANVLLTRIRKPSALQDWRLRIAKQPVFKKAKVALARKLSIDLHRM